MPGAALPGEDGVHAPVLGEHSGIGQFASCGHDRLVARRFGRLQDAAGVLEVVTADAPQ